MKNTMKQMLITSVASKHYLVVMMFCTSPFFEDDAEELPLIFLISSIMCWGQYSSEKISIVKACIAKFS